MTRWMAAAHGAGRSALGTIAIAWLVAVGAARLGIPRVAPSLEVTMRPLETLGIVALLLPVAVLAALLGDEASWLTATAGRGARALRLRWGLLLTVAAVVVGLAWVAALPASVPRGQSLAAWGLMLGLAMWSAVLIRADLAAVIPAVVVVPMSTGRVVPFDLNILYNVELATPAAWVAAVALGSGLTVYVLLGDGRARRGE